jgi:hypothetical protein
MGQKERRKIKLEQMILNVEINSNNPMDINEYKAGILLSEKEIHQNLNINVLDLNRILLSVSEQVLGFVFEYSKAGKNYKDILISKKISKKQVEIMSKILDGNVIVAMINENTGQVISGLKSRVEVKK